jgi:hypothetical protein
MFRHTRNADTMPGIGYPVQMISGMPAATAPARIDAATADQLRRILHVHEDGPRFLPGGCVRLRGPRVADGHFRKETRRTLMLEGHPAR